METLCCSDCKRETTVVLDRRSGDTICTECGLVLESRCVDETYEWRTFVDDPTETDSCRVGVPTDPLLAHSSLTTMITPARGSSSSDPYLRKLRNLNSSNNSERALTRGFNLISSVAETLGLNATIRVRANEIFKQVEEKRLCRGGRSPKALRAACLFIACREVKLARTLKEIAGAAGVPMKEINKACWILRREAAAGIDCGFGDVTQLVSRFCSSLGMSARDKNAVREALDKSVGLRINRSPKSVLAAIIYIVAQLSNDAKKPLIRDIAVAAEVAEVTIKKSYKETYPYISRIIPSWYANKEDIEPLCKP